MNTKQKLTIGIAAIFMVTLTIVGVTYAYFVTRVNGEDETPVNVSTAKLGDVEYQAGNGYNSFDEEGQPIADQITLTGVNPDEAVYKTFSVINRGDKTAGPSRYAITLTSVAGTTHFIHSKTGSDTDDSEVLAKCYNYTGKEALNTNEEYGLSDFTADSATCYVNGGAYNNIELTLWSVPESVYNTYNAAADPAADTLTDPSGDGVEVEPLLIEKLPYNELTTLTDAISIDAGNTVQYYVLKVKYADNGYNQNAENEAELDLTVSITSVA